MVEFEGEWKASFGKPELKGVWLVYGASGSGKTTFLMKLAKYLTNFGRVAYDSLEQGISLSLQTAWKRVGMHEAGNKIVLWDREGVADIRVRLKKRRSPSVVIIDSLPYLHGFNFRELTRLKEQFPNVLFVFIAHEKKGEPEGSLARRIKYDAEIKIHVQGFQAFVTTRYEVKEKGEGGQPFVIWEEGAKRYHSENTEQ